MAARNLDLDHPQHPDEEAQVDRELTFRVPVDQLSRVAGLVGLATAVLAAAGVASSAAYLSAWGIPAPLIRLDPLTAALRADSVALGIAILAATVFGLASLWRWSRRRGRRGLAALGIVVAVVSLLGVSSILASQWGAAATYLGALVVVAAHGRLRLSDRGVLGAFAVVAIVASFFSGVELGAMYRDYPEYQTPLTIEVKAPVGGLGQPVEDHDSFRYEGLYLVFRDGEAVYVSRPGAGSNVWLVQAANIVSIGVGAGTVEGGAAAAALADVSPAEPR